jgi:hypothetical protein
MSDCLEKGFVKNAMQPDASAVLRTTGLSLPVMKITGTETPATFSCSLARLARSLITSWSRRALGPSYVAL